MGTISPALTQVTHEWVSARAVAWVIHAAPVPTDLAFTLTVIAARCDENGRGSYQSVGTIAAKTGKSPKQAQRDIVRLRELGLLLLGDQSLVEHLPSGQRPVVYDVPLTLSGPKPVKESRNKSGVKKPADHGTPMDGTPPMHATPPTDGYPTPPMGGPGTPPIHGSQTTPMNNPEEEPLSQGPRQRAGIASAGTRDTDQQGDEEPTPDVAELDAQVVFAVGATPDEARALIAAVERKHHPGNPSAYLRAMTASGDLGRLLAELRRAPAQTSGPPRIDDYRASVQAACADHGTPGGASACPFCRRGIPASGFARKAG